MSPCTGCEAWVRCARPCEWDVFVSQAHFFFPLQQFAGSAGTLWISHRFSCGGVVLIVPLWIFDRLSKKLVTPVRQAATGRTSVREETGCCIFKREERRAAHCMLFHIKLCYAGLKSILSSPLHCFFFFFFCVKRFLCLLFHWSLACLCHHTVIFQVLFNLDVL